MKISGDSRIKDIIDRYPQTLSVFSTAGFSADNKSDLIHEVGDTLMLKTALNVKGTNRELFIKLLEDKISESANDALLDEGTPKKINLLGYTYCPMKITFRESYEEIFKKYIEETKDKDFKYYIPSGCVSQDPYENIWKADNIDDLPDVIASVGFGDFFRKEFVERFVEKGYFKAISYPKMHKSFINAGIIDHHNHYTVYSVFPLVLLIDRKRLGDFPVPQKWSDLLKPVYVNNIIIGASHGDVHEDLLLYIYKEHGEKGLIKLASNIKTGLHASQMAKIAGSNARGGAAIYVIPWMFAKSCPRAETTRIIWPDDGAITTPTYMLVKKTSMDKYKMFTDFLTGYDYGQKSADNYFPVLNAEVNNRMPGEAKFKWLGWDYINSQSMEELKNYVLDVFKRHRPKNSFLFKEMVL
jgi:ABC-type Fe3+ transport system substrate-binding protein